MSILTWDVARSGAKAARETVCHIVRNFCALLSFTSGMEGKMKKLVCLVLLAAFAGLAYGDTNVTGKWTGSFNITRNTGESNDSTAVLMLTQKGAEITGTVGPNEDEQFTIKAGKIDGDKITMEASQNGHAIKFELVVTGERITGQANMSGENGESAKAKLDVTRQK